MDITVWLIISALCNINKLHWKVRDEYRLTIPCDMQQPMGKRQYCSVAVSTRFALVLDEYWRVVFVVRYSNPDFHAVENHHKTFIFHYCTCRPHAVPRKLLYVDMLHAFFRGSMRGFTVSTYIEAPLVLTCCNLLHGNRSVKERYWILKTTMEHHTHTRRHITLAGKIFATTQYRLNSTIY